MDAWTSAVSAEPGAVKAVLFGAEFFAPGSLLSAPAGNPDQESPPCLEGLVGDGSGWGAICRSIRVRIKGQFMVTSTKAAGGYNVNRRRSHVRWGKELCAEMMRVFVAKSPQVVENGDDPAACSAAVLLSAQTTSDHLHVAHRAHHLTGDQYHIGPGSVEAGGQHAMIAQHASLPLLESFEKIAPGRSRGVAADRVRGNSLDVQARRHFLGVLDRVSKKQDAFLLTLDNGVDQQPVAIVIIGEPAIEFFKQVFELYAFRI